MPLSLLNRIRVSEHHPITEYNNLKRMVLPNRTTAQINSIRHSKKLKLKNFWQRYHELWQKIANERTRNKRAHIIQEHEERKIQSQQDLIKAGWREYPGGAVIFFGKNNPTNFSKIFIAQMENLDQKYLQNYFSPPNGPGYLEARNHFHRAARIQNWTSQHKHMSRNNNLNNNLNEEARTRKRIQELIARHKHRSPKSRNISE